jgi:ethanolamine utilization protein EutN
MLKGTVTGSVWSTRRVDGIPRGAFLEVGSPLVAFDVLGSGIGERVLIATGSVASSWLGSDHPPIDALIIGSLDVSSEPDRGEPANHKPGNTKAPPSGAADLSNKENAR